MFLIVVLQHQRINPSQELVTFFGERLFRFYRILANDMTNKIQESIDLGLQHTNWG